MDLLDKLLIAATHKFPSFKVTVDQRFTVHTRRKDQWWYRRKII